MSAPTVFLDRDGVINRRIMGDYVTDPSEFVILDGAVEAISALNRAGLRTVVVTNQRGIAIGRMTLEAVQVVHQLLSERVASAGGKLDEFYICPHDCDQGCGCRKPDPGLLDQADDHSPVDWERSWLVGDSDSDILAGKARHVRTIKVAGPSHVSPFHVSVDLLDAVRFILDHHSGQAARS